MIGHRSDVILASGVAVSVRLGAYLSLERAMLALDDAGDPMADALRDALDPLWYGLTDDDRVFLNLTPLT